jgi:uncharacterized membrane protein
MERGIVMFGHSILIGLAFYLFMVYVLGQAAYRAENRSLLIVAGVLIYMILFGHKLPSTSINPAV